MAARRRRLSAVVAGLALGASGVAVWRYVTTAVERRAGEALADSAACLLGAPLAELAEPERRLRAVQIGASLDRASHASWPERCGPYAAELRRFVTELRGEHVARVAGRSCADDPRCHAASVLLEETDYLLAFIRTERLGPLDLTRLDRAARASGLPARAHRDVPALPPPARLFDPRDMAPLYQGDYLRLLTDPPGDDELELLFYEHERRYGLCAILLRSEDRARCRPLPDHVPVGFAGELFAGEPGAPSLLYAQGPGVGGWTEGLFDVSDGALLTRLEGRPAGGFVWRDGSFARLGVAADADAVELVRRDAQGQEAVERTGLGASLSAGPRLLWDEIVWASTTGDGQHELYAQRVTRPGELLGPIVRLGQVGPMPEPPSLEFCRTDQSLVLLVGDVRASRSGTAALIFRTTDGRQSRWHPPHLLRVASVQTGFTCERDEATLSWIGGKDDWLPADEAPSPAGDEPRPVHGKYQVHRLRCGPSDCEHRRAIVSLRRYSHESRYVAGDLGTSMVVLWRSPLGDVRMRVAPLDRLDTAPEVPLFDDVDHDGFGWDLERHPIFGRGEAVVVLLGTPTAEGAEPSTYGLRIDASGSAGPVRVER